MRTVFVVFPYTEDETIQIERIYYTRERAEWYISLDKNKHRSLVLQEFEVSEPDEDIEK
jgi:hypothetical protein